ncbi:cysteine hydrolase family protein [Paracoccus sp. DMF-8]|uniref:cysteine hydrolase family protein n=1 Tax=Paracoccus sp. DMF-8 TaxID=3019445 RepID=UPI0023E8A821|nr:cysteine hydrolase family protein [Paracoccus sp. DMF-8]MDF3605443.1 cysteine hydrolase family protein [Paracoccus sp. DMF-8]
MVGNDTAAANAASVIDHARANGDQVIHVRHEFQSPDAPFFIAGSDGAQISTTVAPQDGETVVTKHHPSSFHGTGLDQMLRDRGVSDVVVIGAMSHMCIDATTRASADSGFATTVIHDACATCDLAFDGKTVAAGDVHTAMMAALAFAYANVISTGEYLSQ